MSNGTWYNRLAAADPTLRVYLLGIGGTGLSAIARVLIEQGAIVSGSDRQANANTKRLSGLGARIFTHQAADNVRQLQRDGNLPDVVLLSSAIAADNEERCAFEAQGVPAVKRNAFLPALLDARRVIAVAGTHGKSTTTAMVVQALYEAEIDAGYIIGTELAGYGNAAAGSHPLFVIEADEYDGMFWGLHPSIAVVTNVEWDHVDCYATPQRFEDAFTRFLGQVQEGGVIVSCGDDGGAEALRQRMSNATAAEWQRYGLSTDVDLRAVDLEHVAGSGYRAAVLSHGQRVIDLALQVPGTHNLRNALAALAVVVRCGVDVDKAAASLGRFTGTARRFEHKGEAAGVTIIDDYAHHPTELRATLSAARQRYPERRLWAIVQPHTFSRTRELLDELAASFTDADRVVIMDIYAAREIDDGSISGAMLAARSDHPAVTHVAGLDEVAAHVAERAQRGDVVLTLGAGTSYRVSELLLERLREFGVEQAAE